MNFAEARAKWIEFGADVGAAFDYIETLAPLDQMVMLTIVFQLPCTHSVETPCSHIYALLESKRYKEMAQALRPYLAKNSPNPDISARFNQLWTEYKDTQK